MRATAVSLLAAALALALTPAAPAGAREQSPRCYPKGSSTVAASTRVRVFYSEGDDGDYAYYACDLLTGRRTVLARGTFRDGDSIASVRFAGRVVGFRHGACPFTLNHDPCTGSVRALDVQTRREQSGGTDGAVTALVVSPNGSAAWIETHDVPTRAQTVRRTATGGQATTLASGPLVEPDSLALAGDGTLYWSDGGVPAAATLGAAPRDKHADPEPRGSRKCSPPRSETLAASSRVRLYQRLVGGDRIGYALCDLKRGRRTKIATVSDTEEPFSVRPVRLAGTFAAMGTRLCGKYGCGLYDLRLYDVTGQRAPLRVAAGGWVFDIALQADGAVAWIQGGEPNGYSRPGVRELRRCAAGSCETLDSHTDLGTESLGLSEGSDLYWTRGGQPRHAPMGAGG
jgi:hypothetical protein